MFGILEFNYMGRNGHHYTKDNATAAEIRRIYKRVKPASFSVWFYTDDGYVIYRNIYNRICLQARSINYIGDVAERYNGITKIGCCPPYEYTSC